MASSWTEARARAELVATGAALTRRGLVRGVEGNLSCRLSSGEFLLTPRGVDKGRLSGRDLVRCCVGEECPDAASSEYAVHAAMYAADSTLGAIVHAHPAAVLALSMAGAVPDPSVLLEGQSLVGSVATVPAWPPGSSELAAACVDSVRLAPVLVLARHGVVAVGETLSEAMLRLEVVELVAGMMLASRG